MSNCYAIYSEDLPTMCLIRKGDSPDEVLKYLNQKDRWNVIRVNNYPDAVEFQNETKYYSPASIKKWCEQCITFKRNNPSIINLVRDHDVLGDNLNLHAANDIYKTWFGPFAPLKVNWGHTYKIAWTREQGWVLCKRRLQVTEYNFNIKKENNNETKYL